MPSIPMPARMLTFLVVLCLSAVAPAWAQFETGRLLGTVTDEFGGPLPGVTVEIRAEGPSGPSRTAVTDASGRFRFLGLLPGVYTVSTELEGFARSTLESVHVGPGTERNVEVPLRPSAIDEEITVSPTPLVENRRRTGVRISRDEFDRIPTARDPWAILQTTPGVLTDRINVGGNESGVQTAYAGPGTTADQSTWLVDGVNLTDLAALGSSPAYYDFDSFEEMQVTTGGADPTIATGGVVLNMVTKRGTNEWHGRGRYILGPDDWSGEPEGGANRSNLLNNDLASVSDFGGDLGGPIIRDRLWIWGSYGRTDIDGRGFSAGEPLDTRIDLDLLSTKVTARPASGNTLTSSLYRSDRVKEGRNFERLLSPESTFVNEGAPDYMKIEDTHVFSSNFYLTGLYSYVNNDYSLTPRGGTDRAAFLDGASIWRNSFQLYQTERPQRQYRSDASYFFDVAGGSHELKFGGSYRTQETREESGFPLDQLARDVGGQRLFYFTRDWTRTFENDVRSFYLQDTLSLKNLAFDLGLRYIDQSTRMTGGTAAAHPAEGALMPRVSFGEEDAQGWSSFSPSFGFAYRPHERSVIRGGWNTYDQQVGTFIAEFLSAATMNPFHGGIVKQGVDLNGNFALDAGEPQSVLGILPALPVDLVDEDFDGFDVREVLFGIEHAFLPDIRVGVDLTWRSMAGTPLLRDLLTSGRLATAADYVTGPVLGGAIPEFGTYSVQTYTLNPIHQVSGRQLLTNGEADSEYFGVNLTFDKRLANRWMLRGHVTWQDWNWNVPAGQEALADPNAVLGRAFDGDPFILASGDRGTKADVFINSGWSYNLMGLYQVVPDRSWGFNLGLNVTGREGYPALFYDRFTGADGVARDIQLFSAETFRNDAVHVVDLRLEKSFGFDDYLLTLGVDAFNVFDRSSVLQRAGSVDNPFAAGTITELLGPRTLRLGARFTF